jgi:hypothetical protein
MNKTKGMEHHSGKVTSRDLGVALSAPVPPSQRTKHSGFFITINTNQAPSDSHTISERAETLRGALREVLETEEGVSSIIKYLDPSGSWDKIEKVDTEFVVERGTRQHRIHAHAVIHIEHTTKIHISREALEQHILSYFREHGIVLPNIYVNIKPISGAGNIRAYLEKGLDESNRTSREFINRLLRK